MPHLHLSLQSGDDMILKRMKRRHLRDDSHPLLRRGAQAAAGHRVRRRHHRRLPDRDRRDVRELARYRRGVRAHLSPRLPVLAARGNAGGAHAAGPARASSRSARRGCGLPASAAYRRHLEALAGTRQSILVERDGLGRTEGFALAAIDAGRPGEIVDATISGHDGARLIAVPRRAGGLRRSAAMAFGFIKKVFSFGRRRPRRRPPRPRRCRRSISAHSTC